MRDKNCLKNKIYKYRFLFAKDLVKKMEWPLTSDWEINWKDQSMYDVLEDYMYDKNSYTSKDCIRVEEDGLHLKVMNLDKPEYREHWSGNHMCYYKIGKVEIHNVTDSPYGTWVVRLKTPTKPAFPAVWFLKESYPSEELWFECDVLISKQNYIVIISVPEKEIQVNQWITDENGDVLGRVTGYNATNRTISLDRDINVDVKKILVKRDSITPEIDLMELWNNKRTEFTHSVIWGDRWNKYAKNAINNSTIKPECGKEYEFAVRMSPNKYEFFIDGVKTAEFIQGLSTRKLYMILNSAVLEGVLDRVDIEDFVIRDVKYYKNS